MLMRVSGNSFSKNQAAGCRNSKVQAKGHARGVKNNCNQQKRVSKAARRASPPLIPLIDYTKRPLRSRGGRRAELPLSY